ncbi:LacI family DNA-binding transcriptional regulator [Ketogulonicigenium vulgare]|uniref:Probable transcriptional regulator protein, LacI family protein n=1 Tax=Ketogulonicigenium vulgare (strain WSH-001) TaxID=759362 RepID=F9YB81_KETVW|nr:LacI family DNA-binding transcriptional regulator [Ketogulonicigenium vulgare]ADO44109.1 transcriptional regulator protein [Ketogulonicigenium vulgare Y25]AEM42633.1 probable transcriptional regulator protein, LacI family protein [Ketogulonicigenium vulgare WSH-001]ANW35227.1 LacI family transcriptional regulator [Ketogulonicigenium vulgare]
MDQDHPQSTLESGAETGTVLMRDVAELAGVAISTVSRALTQPDRVSKKTRDRIMAAAAQIGYTPNAVAQNLRRGSSRMMMIVLPGPLMGGASQIVPAVLEGVAAALTAEGFNLMVANLDRSEAVERHILDLAYGGTIAGALTLASFLPAQGARSLTAAGLPLVGILQDVSDQGVPSVVTNDRAAMAAAVQQLLDLGHRRFMYIAAPPGNYHEYQRFGGVLDALREAGLDARAVTRVEAGDSFLMGLQAGAIAAERFAAMAPQGRPTAILGSSDDAAIAFIGAAARLGLRVPEDVSVVGFDGSAVGAHTIPPLTTIAQPARAMGERAAYMLLEQARGGALPPLVTLDSRLILRGSIAAAPAI